MTNVYTWFWVRSSLPKRVWNKCMEYKVTVAQEKVVWYKLHNGNVVPVKVSDFTFDGDNDHSGYYEYEY